jgi:hypothetical protein
VTPLRPSGPAIAAHPDRRGFLPELLARLMPPTRSGRFGALVPGTPYGAGRRPTGRGWHARCAGSQEGAAAAIHADRGERRASYRHARRPMARPYPQRHDVALTRKRWTGALEPGREDPYGSASNDPLVDQHGQVDLRLLAAALTDALQRSGWYDPGLPVGRVVPAGGDRPVGRRDPGVAGSRHRQPLAGRQLPQTRDRPGGTVRQPPR